MSASICLRRALLRRRACRLSSINFEQYAVCRQHSTEAASPFGQSTSSSSVSPSEVSHFTKLASSWWDPHGPSRLLHLMNPLRHDFIQSCLRSDPQSSNGKYTYLDIGCGGGIFATSAARLPSTESVTAIDPTLPVIQVAKAKQRTDPSLQEPKLRYINCAIEDLQSQMSSDNDPKEKEETQDHNNGTKQESKQFDVVTLFEVIEHISRPSEFLSVALKHLRPGGWLIGSTIARHPLSYITTKLIAEAPVIGVVPSGTHDWNQYINPDELKAWFTQENDRGSGSSSSSSSSSTITAKPTLWNEPIIQGVVYVPLLGWTVVPGSETYGNYFFGVQKQRV